MLVVYRRGVLARVVRAVQLAPPMTSLFLMFQARVHIFNILDMSKMFVYLQFFCLLLIYFAYNNYSF